MKIKVNAEHIEEGTRHASQCPVALALRSAYPNKTFKVLNHDIIVREGEFWREIPVPDALFTWLRQYDLGKRMTPISFKLDL